MTYTPLEQDLIERLPEAALLNHKVLFNINRQARLTTKKTLNKLISNLCRKGILIRLRRGRYFVAKNRQPDPLLLGCMAFGGYISFDTALFFYGYRHAFSSTVYCAISKKTKIRAKIAGKTYVGVPVGKFAFGYVYVDKLRIATKAKLVFDTIYTKFKYTEEILPVLELIRDLGEESVNEFLSYLDLVEETAMYERTGLLFDIALGNKKVIAYISRKMKKNVVVRLNPSIRPLGSYEREWHVYDNMNARASVAEGR